MARARAKNTSSSQDDVSLKYAFEKKQQFAKLADYQEQFSKRGEEYAEWVKKLDVLEQCMKQSWAILILKERYLRSERQYLEVYDRATVYQQVFRWLGKINDVLEESSKLDSPVAIDDVEHDFFQQIDALFQASSKISYCAIEQPAGLTAKELTFWKKFAAELMSTDDGKITLKSWEVPGLGALLDGTEFFFDDFHGGEIIPIDDAGEYKKEWQTSISVNDTSQAIADTAFETDDEELTDD